jgi:hypothetical protein
MTNNINYLDIIILKNIDDNSTVEKFGPIINTSFFETANILGSMKVKGLIDIHSSIGGLSPIVVLDAGRDVISMAIKKAAEPLDDLDYEILSNLRKFNELSLLEKNLNINSSDLAFRLYKLKSGGYISDQVQSARVFISLTEKGFLTVKKEYKEVSKEVSKPQLSNLEQKQSISFKDSLTEDIDQEIKDLVLGEPSAQSKNEQISSQPKAVGLDSGSTSANADLLAQANRLKNLKKLPWDENPEKPKLDRTKMLISKIEYYIENYMILAIFLFFLILIILIAIFFILLKT